MRRTFLVILAALITLSACNKANYQSMGGNCALMSDATSAAKAVCFENRGGLAILEGDILLGSVEQLQTQTAQLKNRDPHRGAVAKAAGGVNRWNGGYVPYAFDSNLPQTARTAALDAMAHINVKTGGLVRFGPFNSDIEFIRFQDDGSGCYSQVGRSSFFGSQGQPINLSSGCRFGQAVHEISHALGLWHEQSREDRDSFITINFDNIEAGKEKNFQQQVIFAQDIGTYDFGSIMHYGAKDFSKNGLPTITRKDGTTTGLGQRTALSAGDVAAIKLLYGGTFLEAPSWASDGLGNIALDQTRIRLSVQDNATDETETRLEYSISENGPWSTITTRGTPQPSVWNPILTGLSPSTTYYFRARAANGNTILSAYSPTLSIRTMDFPPQPPSELTANSVGSFSITLNWKDNSTNTDNFIVESSADSGRTWNGFSNLNNEPYSALYNLRPSTTYRIRVRAENSAGRSGPSNQIITTTLAPPPEAPANLRLVSRTKNKIVVAWDDLSSNEKVFRIFRRYSDIKYESLTVPANTTQYEDKDLAPGTALTYSVRAENDISSPSDPSNQLQTSTMPEAPNAPLNLTLQIAKSRQLNLAWVDNSSNEQQFQIQKADSAAGPWSNVTNLASGTTSFMTATVFPLDSNPFFRVIAMNEGGESPSAPAEIKIAIPSTPNLDSVTAVSKTSVTLTWRDTSNNETGFEVWRKAGNGAYSKLASVGQNITSYSAVSSPNTKYTFKIRAANILGMSAFSAEKAATTPTK